MGKITLAAIGLGYGADSLSAEGSVNLAMIRLDADPRALIQGC